MARPTFLSVSITLKGLFLMNLNRYLISESERLFLISNFRLEKYLNNSKWKSIDSLRRLKENGSLSILVFVKNMSIESESLEMIWEILEYYYNIYSEKISYLI